MEDELRSQAVSLVTVRSGMGVFRIGSRDYQIDLNDFDICRGDRALVMHHDGRYQVVRGPMQSRSDQAPIHARSAVHACKRVQIGKGAYFDTMHATSSGVLLKSANLGDDRRSYLRLNSRAVLRSRLFSWEIACSKKSKRFA